jgi:PTH1 family peptidyl-tRNA hydrolase
MKLVVGLGNPGTRYANTRHNVGVLVVEKLLGDGEWKVSKSTGALIAWMNDEVELVKPQGFMNKSGITVQGVFRKHQGKFQVRNLENMWVVHDDLDIELGKYKITFGKGPKVHNGLKSIYEQIGTKDFWHVRVGIDNGLFRESGEGYVLSSFKPEEKKIIDKVIEKIVEELINVLA